MKGEREREREREREKGERVNAWGERAKDQGLVGGWIECYDVLRRVVATKTMRLVTVIVRSVRLRAVTNRIVPTLRFTIPPSSSFPPPLFYSLLLPPRVMKRSFVFMLLFTLVRTARMLFSFFKPVPAKTMLRSQML